MANLKITKRNGIFYIDKRTPWTLVRPLRDHQAGAGGSSQTRPLVKQRKKKTKLEEKALIIKSIIDKIGKKKMDELQEFYLALDAGVGGKDHSAADGMILSALLSGFTKKMVMELYHIGTSRYLRIRQTIISSKELGLPVSTLLNVRYSYSPSHAYDEDTIHFFDTDCKSWEVEEGYACSHRRLCYYLVEEGLSWKVLHSRYEEKCDKAKKLTMSIERWRQYILKMRPEIRLTRVKEDACDACVHLKNERDNGIISDERREEIQQVLDAQLTAAVTQRRLMNDFIKCFAKKEVMEQEMLDTFIPDYFDDFLSDRNKGKPYGCG